MEKILQTVVIFFVLQLVNVILNTLKTLIMAKTDSKHASAIINAVTFGFYTAVVQQVATVDLYITIPVTVITNIIGVYISYWLMNKCKKDSLWRIEIYVKRKQHMIEIISEIEKNNLQGVQVNEHLLTVFSYCQEPLGSFFFVQFAQISFSAICTKTEHMFGEILCILPIDKRRYI